jgi:hypothetical protein
MVFLITTEGLAHLGDLFHVICVQHTQVVVVQVDPAAPSDIVGKNSTYEADHRGQNGVVPTLRNGLSPEYDQIVFSIINFKNGF